MSVKKRSSALKIPPIVECLHLMDRYGMRPHIRRHSLMVARLAAIVGRALNQGGGHLRIPLIIAGALLHDIAKTRSLHEGGNHVEMGRRMVMEMGYPEVAWVVGGHVDSGPEIADAIDEATVVNYADKRIQHDKVVPLKERFEDIIARYGKGPEKSARLQKLSKNMEKLEKEIFSRISLSPEDLESLMENPSSTFLPEDAALKGDTGEASGKKRGANRH